MCDECAVAETELAAQREPDEREDGLRVVRVSAGTEVRRVQQHF